MAEDQITVLQSQVPKALAGLGVAFAQTLLECVDSPHLLEILKSKTEAMVSLLAERKETEAAIMLSYFQRALYELKDSPERRS